MFITDLYTSLNNEMARLYRRDEGTIFVANIIICKGIPFYGYHVGWKHFLKIYLVNPSYTQRCAELLRTGKIWNTLMQPFESHIPHILQFFADFNLYGCAWLRLSMARFRPEIPLEYMTESVGKVLNDSSFPRMSYSELEIDILAEEIENRLELKERNFHHDFGERNDTIGSDYKYVSSMKALWDEDWERRQTLGYSLYNEPASQVRVGSGPRWNKQDDFLPLVQSMVSESLKELEAKQKNFDNFVESDPDMENIPSSFESVNVMFKTRSNPRHMLKEKSNTVKIDLQVPSDEDTEPQYGSDNEIIAFSISTTEDEVSDEETNECLAIGLKRKQQSQQNIQSLIKRQKSTDRSLLKAFSHFSPSFYSSFFKSSIKSLSSQDPNSLSSHGLSQIDNIRKTFQLNSSLIGIRLLPPSTEEVISSFDDYHVPRKEYTEPYFSNSADIPRGVFLHAGVEHTVKGHQANDFEPFEFFQGPISPAENLPTKSVLWEYSLRPPTQKEVSYSFHREKRKYDPQNEVNIFSLRNSEEKPAIISNYSHINYMSILSVEIYAHCKPGKYPNPSTDEVAAVFWKFNSDFTDTSYSSGAIVLGDQITRINLEAITIGIAIQIVDSEVDILDTLLRIVRYHDPDILTGYEIHNASWGYLIDRARISYERNFALDLSRVMEKNSGRAGDKWGYTHASSFQVIGRHMLNIWRVLSQQQDNLLSYSLENIVFKAFKKRIPKYSFDTLTEWYSNSSMTDLEKWFKYHFSRVCFTLDIVYYYELIGRNSEQAKMIGIDFYSVLSRGSQFKVESLLSRIVKTENYIMISANKKQVGQQNALEYIPLVMEPQSGYYTSPILVLDFQSLYPSVMIAYNYCFSTCMGRVTKFKGRNKIGVLNDLELDPGILGLLKDDIIISPNGMLYVKPEIRKSTLSKMLTELLSTRMMVKDSMKYNKDDFNFQKCMNNRQLALKLTANVTYGYTSATYSGRMPCAEIADSIVLSGREILEKTINTIRNTEKWGAEVIYGDTDSIFVHLPGKSRKQAFKIGQDIATTITADNLEPVKLKFEKVYHPCVLLTKKRYVGYSYETFEQETPLFDAKGTETVRRDGTIAEQRIEEKCLRILFETNDLSKVKSYLYSEWKNIMTGNVNVMDFCFNKEVRMGSYKDGTSLPPGANISAKKMLADERQQPQYRERVRYVVISGPPGSRLVDRCVPPEKLLNNNHLHLDADYYITKNIIPPLERIFNILGGDVKTWYEIMPKIHRFQPISLIQGVKADKSLRHYMRSSSCLVCQKSTTGPGVCDECLQNKAQSVFFMEQKTKNLEQQLMELDSICRNCASLDPVSSVKCISQDCPVYYSRVKAKVQLSQCLEVDRAILLKALDW